MNRSERIDQMDRETRALLARNRVEIDSWRDVGSDEPEDDIEEETEEETEDDPQAEMDAIRQDPTHPFNDPKASREEHQDAVDYMNILIAKTLKKG